jgi:hypothetical protein
MHYVPRGRSPLRGDREGAMATFTVKQGRRYRATIALGVLERLASNEMIADKLRNAGFADVSVTGSGGTRYAEALWPQADRSAEMPAQIAGVSEIV